MNMFLVLLSGLMLCSCGLTNPQESTMFGMRESQFRSLTPMQQQQIITAYNQREYVRTQNEPLNNLVGIAGGAVKSRRLYSDEPLNNLVNAAGSAIERSNHFASPSVSESTSTKLMAFKQNECHLEGHIQVCKREEGNA